MDVKCLTSKIIYKSSVVEEDSKPNTYKCVITSHQQFSRLDKNGVLVKESSDCENLRKQIIGIELDVNALKHSSLKHKEHTKPPTNLKPHVKKCSECDTNL
jgi:hypothetical protein